MTRLVIFTLRFNAPQLCHISSTVNKCTTLRTSTRTKDINSIMLLTSHLQWRNESFFWLNSQTLMFDHPKSANCFPFDLPLLAVRRLKHFVLPQITLLWLLSRQFSMWTSAYILWRFFWDSLTIDKHCNAKRQNIWRTRMKRESHWDPIQISHSTFVGLPRR